MAYTTPDNCPRCGSPLAIGLSDTTVYASYRGEAIRRACAQCGELRLLFPKHETKEA
jgi:RNase P subunit RPR2